MLIHRLKNPHNKNRPAKPEMKEARGLCGMRMEIIKATIAMLHHGKYKQARKLKSMMMIVARRNFIFVYWLIRYGNPVYLFVY
jgi:hypothetical protein